MDTAYLVSAGSTSSIILEGTSLDASGTFRMEILPTTLAAGTYKTPNVKFSYLVNGAVLYESVPSNIDKFSVTISSIDSTGVSGTFSGEVLTPLGTTRTITQGVFSAKFSSSATTVPPPATATGQLMLWSKKACTGTTNLSISVQNKTGSITTFHTTAPACGATGAATFDVPAGTYTWKAFCGTTDSVSGTVAIAASQCVKKEVIFPGAGSPAAKMTLTSSAGNCSNIKVNGTYTVGTALAAPNTVEVEVNVTTAGSYNISTPLKNGIWFEGTGSVTGTGLQKITLTGNGTPTTPGANVIAIPIGASNCNFTINAVAGSGGGGGAPGVNSWSFTQGSKTYSGDFPVGATLSDHPTGAGRILWFPGQSGTDTVFSLRIHFSGTPAKPVPGTYKTQPNRLNVSNLTDFNLAKQDLTSLKDIFTAKTLTGTGSNVITIIITSYDDATSVVTGTFSGKAWTGSGGTVDITNGKFTSEVTL
jgi:hypothetical protein